MSLKSKLFFISVLFITYKSFLIFSDSMESLPTPIVPIPSNSDFSIHNIPFGVFSHSSTPNIKKCASRIG